MMKQSHIDLQNFKKKYGLLDYKIYIKQTLDWFIFFHHQHALNNCGYERISDKYIYEPIHKIGNLKEGYCEIKSYATFVEKIKERRKIIVVEPNAKWQIFDTIDDLKLHLLTIKIAGV